MSSSSTLVPVALSASGHFQRSTERTQRRSLLALVGAILCGPVVLVGVAYGNVEIVDGS
ncbi:MAG: hypothetical protein ABSF84_04140 [Acidimicrobiales bacterium]|jgi:hypothetical protein